MITVIKSKDRHYVDVTDQKTWETFDAENKPGPFQLSFGVLKILNEEILSPGGGFVFRTKKDMIVVTYVREGVIIYKAPSEEPTILEMKEFGRNNAAKDTTQYAFNTSEYEEAHVFQCAFDLEECADACEDGSPKTKGCQKTFYSRGAAGDFKVDRLLRRKGIFAGHKTRCSNLFHFYSRRQPYH